MLKNLMLLSGFSTFVVIIIIGLNIFHDFTLSSLPSSTQEHVIPLTPTFDKKTLNDLKQRVVIPVNLDDKSSVVSEDSKNISLITPTPISGQAEPVATQEATTTLSVP